jgi:alpha-N-acetylglucosaminidase
VEDCGGSVIHPGTSCSAFYEWNLRVQLTTWYPAASPNASTVPPRDGDYARKHWSGLVKDYYAARVGEYTQQALQDAGKGVPYDVVAAQRREAQLAWMWTTSTNAYPTDPVGDAVAVSNTLRQKYGGVFQGC